MESIVSKKSENEIIAEFIGWLSGYKKYTNNPDDPGILLYQRPINEKEAQFYSVEELLFDKSWDWLMPVVEKISKLDLGPTENDRASEREIEEATKQAEVCMLCIDTPIQEVYKAVVQFIIWYNGNSK